MMDQTAENGTLIDLFSKEAIIVDRNASDALFSTARRPFLKTDIMRLYQALTGLRDTVREDYFKDYVVHKNYVGQQAYTDLSAAEAMWDKVHDMYLNGKKSVRNARIFPLRDALEPLAVKPDAPEYDTARRKCIAYDTSEDIWAFILHMESDDGCAALWRASLKGTNATRDLLLNSWLPGSYKTSSQSLYDALTRHEVEKTVKTHGDISGRVLPDPSLPRIRPRTPSKPRLVGAA